MLREVTYTPSAGSWAWRKDHVWRDGHLLASVSASEGLRHYHLDHLGSPRLLTDRCAERLASWQLWPFGLDPQGQAGGGGQHPERMRFTGHERDLHLADRASDDLDYMHARYYSPLLARFLSVDPAGTDPRKPQTWNRYTYVLNNPVNMTDPDGKLWWFVVGAAVAGAMLAPEPANAPPTATAPTQPNSNGGAMIAGAFGTGGAATGLRAAIKAFIREAVSWRPQESFASHDEAKRAGDAAAEAGLSKGDLKRVNERELQSAGYDAHGLKRDAVGKENIQRYDIYRAPNGDLYAVRKGRTNEPPVPLGEKLVRETPK